MTNNADITKTLQDSMQAAIIQALGGQEQLVREMVSQVMSKKVDENGREPSYGSGKLTYLEWLSKDLIKESIRNTFHKLVIERQAEIEAVVTDQLSKESEPLAKALVGGLAEHLRISGAYSIKVNFEED